MSTLVVYADADGELGATDVAYATALGGAGGYSNTTFVYMEVGQITGFYVLEAFLSFITSAIGTDTISAVELALYGHTDNSTTDFGIEAAALDWSPGGLTTADWQDGTELDSLTVLATFGTSGFSIAGYNAFTNSGDGSAFNSAVNRTGTTYLVVFSDESRTNSQPTNDEWVKVWSSDEAGTTKDPRLTVTHAASASTLAPMMGGGFFP